MVGSEALSKRANCPVRYVPKTQQNELKFEA